MANTITIPSHCMVTIRRPNGNTETINYTEATKGQVYTMSEKTLAMVNKLMADAGRGQIISYENITKTAEPLQPSAADLAEERYIRQHNATLRAGAGGEKCDQIKSLGCEDTTPAHKTDY